MAEFIDGKRIHELEHALSVVMSMRLAVDNTSYPEAKYITVAELAQAIGVNIAGYVYPTATPGILDYDLTDEIFTGEPYAAKKVSDPTYPYFYAGVTLPSYSNRLNLDGALWLTSLNVANIAPNKYVGTDANRQLVAMADPEGAMTINSYILYWDVANSMYVPYATQKTSDPEYPYFYYNGDGTKRPKYSNNLSLDGILELNQLQVNIKGVSYDDDIYSTILAYNGLQLGFNYLTTNTRIDFVTLTDSGLIRGINLVDSSSIPIIIGSNNTDYNYNGEFIKVDDLNQRFTVNMTKILLDKGTANMYLKLDANKEIEYVTTAGGVTPTDYTFDWDSVNSRYAPYTAKKGTDPTYPYFFTGASKASYYNILKLDGILNATYFTVETGTPATGYYSGQFFGNGMGGHYSNLTEQYYFTLSSANGASYKCIYLTSWGYLSGESTARALPIVLGVKVASTGYNGEYISVDDYAQRFTINFTKILLNKGTASKWLALDANKEIVYLDAPSSSGSVISVALSLPSEFTISGSPVTTTGTLTGSWTTQLPNTVFAGPTSETSEVPTFRNLIANDIPALGYDNYVSWDLRMNGGTTRNIFKTGSNSAYSGINLVPGTGIQMTEGSGIDNFYQLTISATATVTSVGLALPAQFTISNSPVTSSGTLTAAWVAQAPNVVLAGPSNPIASPSAPIFRYLTASDIPVLPYDDFHSWDVEVGVAGKRAIHKSGTTSPSYGSIRFIGGTAITISESSLADNVYGITISSGVVLSGLTDHMTHWASNTTITYSGYNKVLSNGGIKGSTYGQYITSLNTTDAKNTGFQIHNLNSGNTYLPYVCLYKSNGTAALALGDILGQLIFAGRHTAGGTNDVAGAYVQAITAVAWSSPTQHETKLQLMISKAGDSNPQLSIEANKFGLFISATLIPTYANNAAAITGGLTAGQTYRTSTGVLMIVY